MNDSITWVGMDVHKDSLVVAAVNGASGQDRPSGCGEAGPDASDGRDDDGTRSHAVPGGVAGPGPHTGGRPGRSAASPASPLPVPAAARATVRREVVDQGPLGMAAFPAVRGRQA